MNKTFKNLVKELDERKIKPMYHHVLKGKVVASGSKSDMMKLVKKNGATVHKGADSNYILNSPGAKVGDIKEETLDEEVEDIFIKKGDVNQIAMRVARTARSLGLKAALKDGTVRIMGTKKKVSDFMRITIGKTSSGDASTVGKVSSQDDKLLDIQLTKEELELDEAMSPFGKVLKKNKKLIDNDYDGLHKNYKAYVMIDDEDLGDLSTMESERIFISLKKNKGVAYPEGDITAFFKNEKDAEQFVKDMVFNRSLDRLDINLTALGRGIKQESIDEKYDLYHKDFSSAMQHAYSYAKSKMGITVDPKEIDSKVATGPKKPTEGKTNKYMLKGKGGNLQIQVYNKGGSKPFELNMYKEENNLTPESNDMASQAARVLSFTNFREKVDYADVDDDATEKDVENAAKNIIMQLRKSVSMRGNKEVEFADIGHGYKKKVDMKIAQKALDMYNKMKPQEKMKFQTTIAKSYKDLLNAIKGN